MFRWIEVGLSTVMPGLVPGIHDFATKKQDVDGRDKPGHDDVEILRQWNGH